MTIPGSPNPIQPPDSSPERVIPTKAPESDRPQQGSNFQSFMEPSGTSAASPSATTQNVTPMSLAQKPLAMGPPTFQTLMTQAKTAQDSLGTVEKQLGTKNLKFTRSQAHLVRNKLGDANTHLQAAGDKLGANMPQERAPTAGITTIGRFLSYIGDGQDKLTAIQGKLQELAASPNQLTAGQMLLVQVKMSQAQQEVEYSSMLVSKVVESLKTLLNISL